MRTQQLVWSDRAGWTPGRPPSADAAMVLYFGTRGALACGARYDELRGMFPNAHILGCSTGGQINNNDINDDEVVAAAIGFDATGLRLCRQDIGGPQQSRACGEAIGHALNADDLAGVFVLSDGLNVNGSELVAGITKAIRTENPLTGEPCRRWRRFQGDAGGRRLARRAPAWWRGSVSMGPRSGSATAAPAAGTSFAVRAGRSPNRPATMLFELDGEPALDLYERATPRPRRGPRAARLRPAVPDPSLRCRTAGFRGGSHRARGRPCRPFVDLRRRRPPRLDGAIDAPAAILDLHTFAAGAADAARQARTGLGVADADQRFSILVSCIGRRLLMGQRTTDEGGGGGCRAPGADTPRGRVLLVWRDLPAYEFRAVRGLHNQTMTVTTLAEVRG